jgi:hypothetical protein
MQQGKDYAVPRRVSEAPYLFFDYIVQAQTSRRVGPLTLDPFPLAANSAAAGLAGLEVRALEQGDEVVVTIKYSPDSVDDVDIARMLSDFEQLLQDIARCPENRIASRDLQSRKAQ